MVLFMFTGSGLTLNGVQVNGFSLKHVMNVTRKQEQAKYLIYG